MADISLQPYTWERCREFWREYVADPAMMDGSFVYDEDWVKRYFAGKAHQPDRRVFAVCLGEKVIGEITLKHLDLEKKCATLSVHFSRDEYKGHGYGTQAERQIVRYAFEELGLETLYADAVLRNTRSQHVLEKVGFTFLRQDDEKKYYALRKTECMSKRASPSICANSSAG